MEVSIIVPKRQKEPFLDECLASIRAQTYDDIELLVINDKNGNGPAWARNQGLEKAKGQYIAFVDADDYLETNAIEALVEAIDGVDMVCGSFRKFGLFESTVTHPEVTWTPPELSGYVMGNLTNPRKNQILSGCWAKLYKAELASRFPPFVTAEDMAFNFDYLRRANSIRFIPEIVYHNRKREGSLTTTFDEREKYGLFGFLDGLEYVERFLRQFVYEDSLRKALDSSKVYHSMLYFMRIAEHTKLPLNDVFRKMYP